MAELDIGQHCTVPECKQLDFLPILCPSCRQVFCKDHSFVDNHPCSHEYDNVPSPASIESRAAVPACQYGNCGKRELTPVTCEHCGMSLCLQHRHQLDHSCQKYVPPTQKMAKTAEHVQEILEKKKPVQSSTNSSVASSSQGRKSKATAAKVTLMKIKMKATGEKSIPETERVYLQVFLPLNSSSQQGQEKSRKSKPMFFSKKWSIGRVIDNVAAMCKLPNQNNVASSRKLRAFETEGGDILQVDRSLESYVQEGGPVYSGGCLIVEYIASGEEKVDATVYSQ